MTALSQDRDTRKKPGIMGNGPVAANTRIYGGAAVCFNAAGYIVPASDTAGLIFAGISAGPVDNTGGSNADKEVVFERGGLHLLNLETAMTQANAGDQVYFVDDQTVDLAANVTHKIFCGVVAQVPATTLAYIDITPAVKQTDVAAHIADASEAHAASAISITDAGSHTAAADVEAALQEIYVAVPRDIADPGDAGAIPVTRSGCCALTTTEAGGETRTLAVPAKTGIRLAVCLAVDGGDCVITAATPINQTGNNTITLGDAGDTVLLESVKKAAAVVWRVVVNDGCALSTVA